MNNYILSFLMLFVIGCSKFEHPILIINESNSILLKQDKNVNLYSSGSYYVDSLNNIFFSSAFKHEVFEYHMLNDEIFLEKKSIIDQIDGEYMFSISLLKDSIFILTPNSIYKYDNQNNEKELLLKHDKWNNEENELIYNSQTNLQTGLINGKLYFSIFDMTCEDYPNKCQPYPLFAIYDTKSNNLNYSPLKISDEMAKYYLKYNNFIMGSFNQDTFYFTSSVSKNIIGVDLKTNEQFYSKNMVEPNLDMLSHENYDKSMMEYLSFSPQFSDLKFNEQTDELIAVEWCGKDMKDGDGLINYEGAREKKVWVLDNNLKIKKEYRIEKSFTETIIILNDGLLLSKLNENEKLDYYFYKL